MITKVIYDSLEKTFKFENKMNYIDSNNSKISSSGMVGKILNLENFRNENHRIWMKNEEVTAVEV